MQELVVLGLIPGTNIQITFGLWLNMIAMMLGFYACLIIRRRHLLRDALITGLLMLQTRHPQSLA